VTLSGANFFLPASSRPLLGKRNIFIFFPNSRMPYPSLLRKPTTGTPQRRLLFFSANKSPSFLHRSPIISLYFVFFSPQHPPLSKYISNFYFSAPRPPFSEQISPPPQKKNPPKTERREICSPEAEETYNILFFFSNAVLLPSTLPLPYPLPNLW